MRQLIVTAGLIFGTLWLVQGAAAQDKTTATKVISRPSLRPPPPESSSKAVAPAKPTPDPDNGRPVELVARDLGVTPDQFREAFKSVRPAPVGQQPTEEQRKRNRKVLSEKLGVSPEKLDEVMDKYRPGGPTNDRPPRRKP